MIEKAFGGLKRLRFQRLCQKQTGWSKNWRSPQVDLHVLCQSLVVGRPSPFSRLRYRLRLDATCGDALHASKVAFGTMTEIKACAPRKNACIC